MQKITPRDLRYMRRALQLARRGEGCVHPNPMVGALLVKRGRIVGEGWHERFGGPHAEVLAVRHSAVDPRGATLYVTREPCSHYGKTPPCADFIIQKRIRRVVAARKDTNPIVNGRGLRKLRRAGVQVVEGVLREEEAALNRDFDHWVRNRRPYAVVKIAQSLDGKIAAPNGQSRWITGEKARDLSHRFRAAADAVLVGVNTVLKDDPLLNVRGGRRRKKNLKMPFKVVLDRFLRTPVKARIFSRQSAGPVILATTRRADRGRLGRLRKKAQVLVLPEKNGRIHLKVLFKRLAEKGIVRLLVEGGGEVTADVLRNGLARELFVFVAPKLIGGEKVASVGSLGVTRLSQAVSFRFLKPEVVGGDILLHGFLKKNVHRHY